LDNLNKQEPLLFKQSVPKGTKLELRERIKADGTIENIKVRFFAGQEMDLKVKPMLIKKGDMYVDLINYVGADKELSGDDDIFSFDTSLSVENDDEILIIAQNVNVDFDYTLFCIVQVDYYGGKKRVV